MIDNIGKVYKEAKFILDNTPEYRDCNIEYIFSAPHARGIY